MGLPLVIAGSLSHPRELVLGVCDASRVGFSLGLKVSIRLCLI